MVQATGLSVLMLFALAATGSSQSAAAAGSVDSARSLIAEGKPAEALRQLDRLAAENPEPPGVERLRGILDYQNNQLPEAEAAFAKAMQQDASDLESRQMEGVVLFRRGKPAEAIPLLEAAHSAGAVSNADPNYVLALCYIATGRYDDARHAFAAQYNFAPDSAAAWLVTGRMLFRQEQVAPAKAAALSALKLDPHLPLAHRLLGEIALAEGDLPGAIAQLEQERTLDPLDGETYSRLGDAYLRSGDAAKAQQVLDRAVLLEPNASGPYILLGKALLEQQDPASAAMVLQHAAQMDPANSMTHMLLARAFTATGRSTEASREFAILQRLHEGQKAPAPAAR